MLRESDVDDCCCRLVEFRFRINEGVSSFGHSYTFFRPDCEARTITTKETKFTLIDPSNLIINLASTDCSCRRSTSRHKKGRNAAST
jgi:hypothetical protein